MESKREEGQILLNPRARIGATLKQSIKDKAVSHAYFHISSCLSAPPLRHCC